jgi:hypothetical protein
MSSRDRLWLYRHSGFGARFGRKSISSRNRTAGRLFAFQGFAAPKWTIFAESVRDAAAFSPRQTQKPARAASET